MDLLPFLREQQCRAYRLMQEKGNHLTNSRCQNCFILSKKNQKDTFKIVNQDFESWADVTARSQKKILEYELRLK